jgi:hypothetical protein
MTAVLGHVRDSQVVFSEVAQSPGLCAPSPGLEDPHHRQPGTL